ncbi:unnamed protein product [Protopolystoma xenopodis]|uniref:Uncharacterized protein n=1 Tax=Protopolystoma xenopodis TaxID=117903 RepID=A0A3S5ASB9_9PLAT|nr:unnamed protein product [Protopolystoma xenopodis]
MAVYAYGIGLFRQAVTNYTNLLVTGELTPTGHSVGRDAGLDTDSADGSSSLGRFPQQCSPDSGHQSGRTPVLDVGLRTAEHAGLNLSPAVLAVTTKYWHPPQTTTMPSSRQLRKTSQCRTGTPLPNGAESLVGTGHSDRDSWAQRPLGPGRRRGRIDSPDLLGVSILETGVLDRQPEAGNLMGASCMNRLPIAARPRAQSCLWPGLVSTVCFLVLFASRACLMAPVVQCYWTWGLRLAVCSTVVSLLHLVAWLALWLGLSVKTAWRFRLVHLVDQLASPSPSPSGLAVAVAAAAAASHLAAAPAPTSAPAPASAAEAMGEAGGRDAVAVAVALAQWESLLRQTGSPLLLAGLNGLLAGNPAAARLLLPLLYQHPTAAGAGLRQSASLHGFGAPSGAGDSVYGCFTEILPPQTPAGLGHQQLGRLGPPTVSDDSDACASPPHEQTPTPTPTPTPTLTPATGGQSKSAHQHQHHNHLHHHSRHHSHQLHQQQQQQQQQQQAHELAGSGGGLTTAQLTSYVHLQSALAAAAVAAAGGLGELGSPPGPVNFRSAPSDVGSYETAPINVALSTSPHLDLGPSNGGQLADGQSSDAGLSCAPAPGKPASAGLLPTDPAYATLSSLSGHRGHHNNHSSHGNHIHAADGFFEVAAPRQMLTASFSSGSAAGLGASPTGLVSFGNGSSQFGRRLNASRVTFREARGLTLPSGPPEMSTEFLGAASSPAHVGSAGNGLAANDTANGSSDSGLCTNITNGSAGSSSRGGDVTRLFYEDHRSVYSREMGLNQVGQIDGLSTGPAGQTTVGCLDDLETTTGPSRFYENQHSLLDHSDLEPEANWPGRSRLLDVATDLTSREPNGRPVCRDLASSRTGSAQHQRAQKTLVCPVRQSRADAAAEHLCSQV